MRTLGRNINLYLMDSDPKERIKATLANWTGVAYKIPRTAIEKSRSIAALKQSGVYFLFGTDEETDKDIVYIGQANLRSNGNGVLERVNDHRKDPAKDYWTEAVIFTTSNDSFGSTEISYLENQFYIMAERANRYETQNKEEPSKGNLTEEKESELLEFIDNAKIIMGAMGYKVFEPYVNQTSDSTLNTEHLRFNYRGLEATGQRTSEGFVVLAGSQLSPTMTASASETARRFRRQYAEQINDDFILTEDALLTSPSAAAGFVGGANLSGNITWVNSNRETLKDIENQETT